MIQKFLAYPSLVIFAPIGAVIIDAQAGLIFLLLLIIIDLYYGIKKAFVKKVIPFSIKNKEFWRTVRSRGIRRTWIKATEYAVGIIATTFCQALFFPTFTIGVLGKEFNILLFVIMSACLIEMYSIFENINTINPDNGLNKIAVFVKKYFNSYIVDVLSKIKNGNK